MNEYKKLIEHKKKTLNPSLKQNISDQILIIKSAGEYLQIFFTFPRGEKLKLEIGKIRYSKNEKM